MSEFPELDALLGTIRRAHDAEEASDDLRAEVERLRGRLADIHDLFCMPDETPQQAYDRLHSWAGLMWLLDQHWPENMIPTREDDEARDAGVRIVSLLRLVNREREEVRALRDEGDALRAELREARKA